MHIHSGSNAFTLELVGYEFPDGNNYYDANWLMVAGSVRCQAGYWQFRDPCLLTSEVEELIQFLAAVATGEAPAQEIGFIESNLYFTMTESDYLRIYFTLEAAPPWQSHNVVEENPFFLEFEIPKTQLLEAAASLRRQLSFYPPRAHTGKRAK